MQVWSLGWEDPLEKEVATCFSILAWEIPWTKESGRLQSPGSPRVRHDWATYHAHKYLMIRLKTGKLSNMQSVADFGFLFGSGCVCMWLEKAVTYSCSWRAWCWPSLLLLMSRALDQGETRDAPSQWALPFSGCQQAPQPGVSSGSMSWAMSARLLALTGIRGAEAVSLLVKYSEGAGIQPVVNSHHRPHTHHFPAGPVAKMPSSQGRGPRFNPWSGN